VEGSAGDWVSNALRWTLVVQHVSSRFPTPADTMSACRMTLLLSLPDCPHLQAWLQPISRGRAASTELKTSLALIVQQEAVEAFLHIRHGEWYTSEGAHLHSHWLSMTHAFMLCRCFKHLSSDTQLVICLVDPQLRPACWLLCMQAG
jgi:hypothetical protein